MERHVLTTAFKFCDKHTSLVYYFPIAIFYSDILYSSKLYPDLIEFQSNSNV